MQQLIVLEAIFGSIVVFILGLARATHEFAMARSHLLWPDLCSRGNVRRGTRRFIASPLPR
jgi:hypothetical protein